MLFDDFAILEYEAKRVAGKVKNFQAFEFLNPNNRWAKVTDLIEWKVEAEQVWEVPLYGHKILVLYLVVSEPNVDQRCQRVPEQLELCDKVVA